MLSAGARANQQAGLMNEAKRQIGPVAQARKEIVARAR